MGRAACAFLFQSESGRLINPTMSSNPQSSMSKKLVKVYVKVTLPFVSFCIELYYNVQFRVFIAMVVNSAFVSPSWGAAMLCWTTWFSMYLLGQLCPPELTNVFEMANSTINRCSGDHPSQ